LSGQATPAALNLDELNERLHRADYRRVTGSLAEVHIRSLMDLLATYLVQQSDLAPWLSDAEINTDRTLRLQYLAGLGLNLKEESSIHAKLRGYRWSSPQLFTGSQQIMDALSKALAAPPGGQ
jgi:spermidine synthase